MEEEAQHTDAYQTNRNLLLSAKAEADSLPGLEILANEVKCSHGATTSRIDPQELFYLRSRGVPMAEAEKLIAVASSENASMALITKRLRREHFKLWKTPFLNKCYESTRGRAY